MGGATHADNNSGKSNKGLVSIFQGHGGAATMAGTLEILFFHPFDTVAKRMMSNTTSLRGSSFGETMSNVNKCIFKKHADASFTAKVAYLYPGSLYAMTYKVLQRVYKFAGQPIVRDAINENYGDNFKAAFGKKSKMMSESVAGSLIGIGEVILLPLDRLKVLSQTNPEALQNRGLLGIIRSEGIAGLYAGTVVTMTRNAPGSFCLFGGTAFTKDIIFGLEDYSKATFVQNMIASAVGSCLSITVTNPMDVIKTRIQNKDFGAKHSGASILTAIIREEGVGAFFKGLTPKVLASAPKLVFAYTMTEYFLTLMGKSTKK
ncbi:mitochondrial carrier protein, putative [Bodo saltans]|uniref:Mitochondrial carrier protein, putative n=1 Tax=Bodo saltans TaxID=75058 RepID=A0A0S4JHF7_BODSA|nr:mitochondrial carrier protein, putative [Bodo saltans]|eukprot:CUG88891.1 mitochondrial carrier protein, putative [Bodo saltans]